MRRGKKPHFFNVGNERFRTERLGLLEAIELLARFAPTILKVQAVLGTHEEGKDVNLSEVLKEFPEKIITEVCTELLYKTSVEESENTFVKVNPNDFEGFEELIGVIVEVFKYNYPDFFAKGEGTQEIEVLEPKKEDKNQKIHQFKSQDQEFIKI